MESLRSDVDSLFVVTFGFDLSRLRFLREPAKLSSSDGYRPARTWFGPAGRSSGALGGRLSGSGLVEQALVLDQVRRDVSALLLAGGVRGFLVFQEPFDYSAKARAGISTWAQNGGQN